MFGAVGPVLGKPVFMLAPTTNKEWMKKFVETLIEIVRDVRGPKPVLILDNHRAHTSIDSLRVMEPHFEVVFQPAYSSEFNCQETVWSLAKRAFSKALYRRTRQLTLQRHFAFLLQRTLDQVADSADVAQICKANNRYTELMKRFGEEHDEL